MRKKNPEEPGGLRVYCLVSASKEEVLPISGDLTRLLRRLEEVKERLEDMDCDVEINVIIRLEKVDLKPKKKEALR